MRFPLGITRNLLLKPTLALFGVRSSSSYVDLTDDAMTVRMGRWFDERVPLAAIASFAPSEWPVWGGYGVKLAPREGVGVVASTEGVVHIGFKRPQPMRAVIVSRAAERLWLSLADRDGFLSALSTSTGLPISPPTGFWRETPTRA